MKSKASLRSLVVSLLLTSGMIVACEDQHPTSSTTSTDAITSPSEEVPSGSPEATPTVTPTGTPTATPTSTPTATPTATPTSSPNLTMAEKILELTNYYRAQYGVAPLTLNPKLTQSAQGYAEDMAESHFFSHTGLDGSTPRTRIEAAGYHWSTWGENIANGYTTAEKVMTGWMNSSGHRANILSAKFKELGVGYANNGTAYWVQDFGAP